jgi:hypothetical protein
MSRAEEFAAGFNEIIWGCSPGYHPLSIFSIKKINEVDVDGSLPFCVA